MYQTFNFRNSSALSYSQFLPTPFQNSKTTQGLNLNKYIKQEIEWKKKALTGKRESKDSPSWARSFKAAVLSLN
jgi:hypothetical protein